MEYPWPFSKNNFLVVGRAGMDLYAEPQGATIENAEQYFAALGGSAANSAAAIVKSGAKASLVSCVSDDAVGRFVRAQLGIYGIDDRYVSVTGGEVRNSLAVVETRSENCQAVIYRNNAADFQLSAKHVADVDLAPFGAVVVTGTSLALEPSRGAVLDLVHRANLARVPVVLDIDYRRYSWASEAEATHLCGQVARLSAFVVGNEDEFDVVAGSKGAGLAAAKALAKAGAVAIYKMGEKGSITFSGETSFETPVFKVTALKPTGAGDAFLGTLCASLGSGKSLEDSVKRGSAAAAIVVTKVGCAPATPSLAELDAFMQQNSLI
ncbi:MAG: PfkB family carbohydrate kinase [Rhizobiaceae bacterium]